MEKLTTKLEHKMNKTITDFFGLGEDGSDGRGLCFGLGDGIGFDFGRGLGFGDNGFGDGRADGKGLGDGSGRSSL